MTCVRSFRGIPEPPTRHSAKTVPPGWSGKAKPSKFESLVFFRSRELAGSSVAKHVRTKLQLLSSLDLLKWFRYLDTPGRDGRKVLDAGFVSRFQKRQFQRPQAEHTQDTVRQ